MRVGQPRPTEPSGQQQEAGWLPDVGRCLARVAQRLAVGACAVGLIGAAVVWLAGMRAKGHLVRLEWCSAFAVSFKGDLYLWRVDLGDYRWPDERRESLRDSIRHQGAVLSYLAIESCPQVGQCRAKRAGCHLALVQPPCSLCFW